MDLQWNRIPKIYEKSVDAYGIKSRWFAGFASRNLSSKTQRVCDYAIGATLIQKTMAAIPCNP